MFDNLIQIKKSEKKTKAGKKSKKIQLKIKAAFNNIKAKRYWK